MRNGKLYVCAVLILFLMVLQFCFPVPVGQARAWAVQVIDPDGFCLALACSFGQALRENGLKDGLIAAFRLGEEVFR